MVRRLKSSFMEKSGLYFLITQHIIGLLAIGPCTSLVMRTSLADRIKGIQTALGAVVGSFAVKSLSALGLTLIWNQYPLLFHIFKILGTAYLITLGMVCFINSYKVFSLSLIREIPCSQDSTPFKKSPFLAGFFISMANPLSSIRFIALFSTVTTTDTPFLIQLSYIVILASISLIFYMFLALFFSTSIVQRIVTKYKYILDAILGATLIYWGIKIFKMAL